MWWSRSCTSERSNMSLRVLGAPCHDWLTGRHLRWGYRRRNKTSPGFGWISRHPTSSSRSGTRWMTPFFFEGFVSLLAISYYWPHGPRSAGLALNILVMLWCGIFMIKSANEANKWLHWNWFVTCACLKFVANSIEACLSSMADIIFQCSNPNRPSEGEGWHCVESISRLRAAGVALTVRKWCFAGVSL